MTISTTTTFETMTCGACHVAFALETEFYKKAVRLGSNSMKFYCPRGCHIGFTGPTEEDRLRNQLSSAQEEVNCERGRRQNAEDQRDTARKQRNAFKGHLNHTKRDISCGKCPCCRRNFQNLQRHMREQHPEYK